MHKLELTKVQQASAEANQALHDDEASSSSPWFANPTDLTQSRRTIWQLQESNRDLTHKTEELKAFIEHKIQGGKLRAQQRDQYMQEQEAHIKEQNEKWQQLNMESAELGRAIAILLELHSRTTLPNTTEARRKEVQRFEEYLNNFKDLHNINIDTTENLDGFFKFLNTEFARLRALENAVKIRPRSFSS